jgi:hypothetical protein
MTRIARSARMARIAAVAAAAACATLSAVVAASPPAAGEPTQIHVAVGDTVERDVGFALGLLCDDLTVIQAELRPGTPESNVFRVTGVQPGDTRCRVGTDPSRPSFVFEIHVTARHTAPL